MDKTNSLTRGIPVAPSLGPVLKRERFEHRERGNKKRLLRISILAVLIAAVISGVAKFLVLLINFFTNLAFYGVWSFAEVSPLNNSLGLWVIVIPAIGGVIVGLMSLYGSRAIRGHGIPEAMEQILTNKSKIRPAITYLKPLSSAIAIGTGGPFGAEGPIIATGGALGSTLGQLLKISHKERKILLAAGATAGMAAIFGTPIAGIFLAIELLLFEFSPRSILPVALACITGAAGHHLLFGDDPVFAMEFMAVPSNTALFIYSVLGAVVGLLSVGVCKVVNYIEDAFEKLPIHWMWWPAIGGLVVGVVGFLAPRTLGVGYENITDILSGSLPLQALLFLCLLKFISWAIALGSGTSGGTLAPLFTIGGATGALLGLVCLYFYPDAGITVPLAALIGMAAMFTGSSRALLTSIVFALESTGQANALLPLLGACTASFFVSFFLMENTIMTEKIARRGVRTPHSYESDLLEQFTVGQIAKASQMVIGEENTIKEVRDWHREEKDYQSDYFIAVSTDGKYRGIFSMADLHNDQISSDTKVASLVKGGQASVIAGDTLRTAAETMASEGIDVLPVVEGKDGEIRGVISYHDILAAYKHEFDDEQTRRAEISLKRSSLKMLVRGQKVVSYITRRRH